MSLQPLEERRLVRGDASRPASAHKQEVVAHACARRRSVGDQVVLQRPRPEGSQADRRAQCARIECGGIGLQPVEASAGRFEKSLRRRRKRARAGVRERTHAEFPGKPSPRSGGLATSKCGTREDERQERGAFRGVGAESIPCRHRMKGLMVDVVAAHGHSQRQWPARTMGERGLVLKALRSDSSKSPVPQVVLAEAVHHRGHALA